MPRRDAASRCETPTPRVKRPSDCSFKVAADSAKCGRDLKGAAATPTAPFTELVTANIAARLM